MSIIEKAVNKLEKQAEAAPAMSSSGEEPLEVKAADSVQDAVRIADEKRAAQVADKANEAAVESSQGQSEFSSTGGAGLVNISFDELQRLGMLTPAVPRSVIAEEYRVIKRPLLINIGGESSLPIQNANLIMVTSALEGDGKTFSAINLALSIAMEQDKTVLLVDADTAKAEAGRLLGVPSDSRGLIDVLEDRDLDLSNVILPTNVEKLRILPAGNVHAHANELLASDAMHKLMLELSERYSDRVIVFDSPPLLLTTEAGVLASFMGQIVFVIAAESTPHHAVTEALEHIGQDKVVGTVLNRASKRGKLFGYGYGYGYGYGKGRYGYGYGNRDMQTTPEAR